MLGIVCHHSQAITTRVPYPEMERLLTSRKDRSHCMRVKLHTCHIYNAWAQGQSCFEIKDSISLDSQSTLYFDTILRIYDQCNNNYSFKIVNVVSGQGCWVISWLWIVNTTSCRTAKSNCKPLRHCLDCSSGPQPTATLCVGLIDQLFGR